MAAGHVSLLLAHVSADLHYIMAVAWLPHSGACDPEAASSLQPCVHVCWLAFNTSERVPHAGQIVERCTGAVAARMDEHLRKASLTDACCC